MSQMDLNDDFSDRNRLNRTPLNSFSRSGRVKSLRWLAEGVSRHLASLLVLRLMPCQVQSQVRIWVWGVAARKVAVATAAVTYLLEDK